MPNTVPPKGASYQVTLAPAGKVPIMVAVKTAVLPAQTATSVTLRSKLDKLFKTVPTPPVVAPFGGNSLKLGELVTP